MGKFIKFWKFETWIAWLELPPMAVQFTGNVSPSVSPDHYTVLPNGGSSGHVIRKFKYYYQVNL